MWQIWLIVSGICFIAEIMTVGFLIFWLSIGALFAMIVSFFTDNIIIQTAVFVISSTILIFATKPFVKKFAKGKPNFKSNVYSIIGDTGIVTKNIDSILNYFYLMKKSCQTSKVIIQNMKELRENNDFICLMNEYEKKYSNLFNVIIYTLYKNKYYYLINAINGFKTFILKFRGN